MCFSNLHGSCTASPTAQDVVCPLQINHAGEGGIWGELVNDRSFEGTAYYADPTFLLENDTRRELATSPSDWPRSAPGADFGIAGNSSLSLLRPLVKCPVSLRSAHTMQGV